MAAASLGCALPPPSAQPSCAPILPCAATSTESELQLGRQAEYVYGQIISLLTAGITRIYERLPAYDLRGLLSGAEKFLDRLLKVMDRDPSFLLNASHCLQLDPGVRSVVGNVMQACKVPDLL